MRSQVFCSRKTYFREYPNPIFLSLAYFGISTLQFCFCTEMKRRTRVTSTKLEKRLNKVLNLIFGTEIWAQFLIFIIQDFPYLILRIIILAKYRLSEHYTIYFFVSKFLFLQKLLDIFCNI